LGYFCFEKCMPIIWIICVGNWCPNQHWPRRPSHWVTIDINIWIGNQSLGTRLTSQTVSRSYYWYQYMDRQSVLGHHADPADSLTELLLISIYGSVISPWAPGWPRRQSHRVTIDINIWISNRSSGTMLTPQTVSLSYYWYQYVDRQSVLGHQADPADSLTELLLISTYGSAISPRAPGWWVEDIIALDRNWPTSAQDRTAWSGRNSFIHYTDGICCQFQLIIIMTQEPTKRHRRWLKSPSRR